jgi:hypothetical protein
MEPARSPASPAFPEHWLTSPSEAPTVGDFSFEGARVEAFRSSDRKWHLRSAGCEASDFHLGTATRTLFNEQYHETTRPLIDAILAWQESVEASQVATAPKEIDASRAPRAKPRKRRAADG